MAAHASPKPRGQHALLQSVQLAEIGLPAQKEEKEKPELATMTNLTCLAKCLIIPDQVL